ncbi:MAG: hypothetical protein HON90_01400 [Halobacteriovoraceae bacterium]|jgi:hypothetical protein|nr:hypothetical protein [Halobacteriovoraceae bacterium]
MNQLIKNITVLSIFSFTLLSYASEGSVKKDTCKFYDNLYTQTQRDNALAKYGRTTLYAFKANGREINYTVKDIIDNYYQTNQFISQKHAKDLSEKLVSKALISASEYQKSLYSISNITFDESNLADLRKCTNKSKQLRDLDLELESTSIQDNKIRSAYYVDLLINSLKIYYIFNVQNEILDSRNSLVGIVHRSMRKTGNITGNAKVKLKNKIQEDYSPIIKQMEQQLTELFQASPALFELENDFQITNWFKVKISTSKIYQKIISTLDEKFLAEVLESMAITNSIYDLIPLFEKGKYKKYLDDFIKAKLADPLLASMIDIKIKQVIEDIRIGSKNICESNGKQLHHSKSLISKTLEDTIHYDNFKLEMVKNQVGYCSLMESQPLEDIGNMNWRTVTGLSLFAAGGALQFFFGIGSIPMYFGATLVVADNTHNYYKAINTEKRERALSYSGWQSYKSTMDVYSKKLNIAAELGADVALTAISFGLGPLIKQMSKFKDVDSANTMGYRLRRGPHNKNLIKNADSRQYKTNMWERYKIQREAYHLSANKYKLKARLSQVMNINRNKLPSYHSYGDSGNELLGILNTITDIEKLPTDDGAKAISMINKWLEKYKGHRVDMGEAIDRGMAAKTRVKELKELKKKFKYEDFTEGKSHTVQLTKMENNKLVQTEKTFYEYNDILALLREEKSLAKHTFARNAWEELTLNSNLYKLMDEQALGYRQFEFIRDYLQKTDAIKNMDQLKALKKEGGTLSELETSQLAQIKMYEDTLDVLTKDHLRPRRDALNRLYRKEIRAEYRDFIRGLKSKKELLKKLNFKLPSKVIVDVNEAGFVSNYLRTIITTSVTLGSSAYVYRYSQSGGSFSEVIAKAGIQKNNFLRLINKGFTLDEEECARKGRYSQFRLCFAKNFETSIGVEYARAKVRSDDYSIATDTKILKKLSTYAFNMILLRKKTRGPEIFDLAVDILDASYDDVLVHEIKKKVEESNPNFPNLGDHIAQILTASSTEQISQLIEQFDTTYAGQFNKLIKTLIDSKEKMIKALKNTGRMSLDVENEITRSYDYEENQEAIIDKDIYEVSLEALETVGAQAFD